jgi:RNA polymerase sigma-70 factor, ECF subfamily
MQWEWALPKLETGTAGVTDAMATMDSDAFAGFYQRSARPLWAYLARVSGDPALADDLMQEAYLRFLGTDWAGNHVRDGEVASRKYLFRIATNLLKDHWRKPRTGSLEELPEAAMASGPDGFDTAAQEQLSPALKRMTPRDRQLLWLAHAEGYTHREIAEITGLQSASIRLLLFRARGRIARLLRDQAAGTALPGPEAKRKLQTEVIQARRLV